ncbi:VWA domain-containing protein [Aeoliella sp. SH292]|uniref:vWA domain-containing protein n=1 Tax=Aeoliella sp. SH292 TaxID=3454464 RepID=UPI003F9C4642
MFTPRSSRPRCLAPRRGAILILVAFVLPVLVIMMAFAIDVAWMQLAKTELRTATDAAARAGAKVLSVSQDQDAARAAAVDAASRNVVAGEGLALGVEDVQFGRSEQANSANRYVFTPASAGVINAVNVSGRRTSESLAGPVDLFFTRLVGVEHFEPTQEATSTILDRDICLVIDRSGSMGLDLSVIGDRNGQNCGPLDPNTRFAALNSAINGFLDELDRTFPEEQVALASYSSQFSTSCRGYSLNFQTADIRQRLTQDHSLIRAPMNTFMTRGIGGSTAIGEGLRRGITAITDPQRARPFAVKTIVLMTDGLHNSGIDPRTVAYEAAALDITVHTISFSAGADQARMRDVARTTGGQHYHADTAGDLNEVFREIARTLPVLLTK